MNSLYQSAPVRAALGDCLRPGGLQLTERMLMVTKPQRGQLLVDAGCGAGATLRYLRQLGYLRVLGIDHDRQLLMENRQQHLLAAGDLEILPLASASVDLLFCECALNVTKKHLALAEFHRVLRRGAQLALSDIYLRQLPVADQAWPVHCCFAGADHWEATQQQVEAAGFQILLMEDHSPFLTRAAAEFVFAHGSLTGFWRAVTGSQEQAAQACAATAATRPGLFLLVARRQ